MKNVKATYYLELGQTALLMLILHYFLQHDALIYTGLAVVLLGLLFWQVRNVNQYIWKYINQVTQIIGEFILLLVVYTILVIPIGLIFQLKNRKPKRKGSSLVDVEKPFTAEDLKKTW